MGKRGPRPGTPRSGGRQKGTPNKITADLKEVILAAFNVAGGEEYLVRVAKEDPRTFCSLLGNIVPGTIGIGGPGGVGPVPIETAIRWLRDDECDPDPAN
jgi:hypothetical protein